MKLKQIEEDSIRRKERERIHREQRETIKRASLERERIELEESERRRLQEVKDLAAQADLEARLVDIEAEVGSEVNSETLRRRLRDFNEQCPAITNCEEEEERHNRLPEVTVTAGGPQGNPGSEHQAAIPDDKAKSTASWIASLPSPAKMKPPLNCHPNLIQTPFAKSIPKLTLTKFDGSSIICRFRPPFWRGIEGDH